MALLKDYLIAHYKMNENTANDNDELVTNGDFAAWTDDDPDGWDVGGEVTTDPEVSEVGTGEGHGGVGTGMCNIYTSDGTAVFIKQSIATIIGRKYRFSVKIDTAITGSIMVRSRGDIMWAYGTYTFNVPGIYTWTAVGVRVDETIQVQETGSGTDVTIDDVSVKLCAVEDSSGNDHDGLAQQDTDAIHVAGKINGAFDFNGATDAIIIPAHADIALNLGSWSFAFWLNIRSDGGGDAARIFDSGDLITPHFFYTSNEVGSVVKLRAKIDAGVGTDATTILDAGIALNVWHFVVFVFDGTNVTIYVNAEIPAQTQQSLVGVVSDNSDEDSYIGNYITLNRCFDGLIDNVMFFNKELTPLEVKLLYNGSAGTENIPSGIQLSRTGQHFSSFPEN